MSMKRGSILAETVLVMPLLLLLIFGTIQFALIWTAKQMTAYAAYCAARAWIVANPGEQFSAAQQAAELALSWVSLADDGGVGVTIPGWGQISGSGRTINGASHVRTAVIIRDGGSDTVTSIVQFRFPLLVPGMGINRVISGMVEGNELPPEEYDFYKNLNDAARGVDAQSWPFLTFTETCVLPMPYSTENFPSGAFADIDIRRGYRQ